MRNAFHALLALLGNRLASFLQEKIPLSSFLTPSPTLRPQASESRIMGKIPFRRPELRQITFRRPAPQPLPRKAKSQQSQPMGYFPRSTRAATISLILFLTLPNPTHAACAAPTGVAGQMKYNADYHIPQYCDNTNWIAMGAASSAATGFNYLATDTTHSTNAYGVWGDGTYLYVADFWGGLDVYSFNGASLTYKTTNTTNSTDARGVWGDGTYIYVADNAGGLDVYSFNGTSLTYITSDTTHSTSAYGVWGDGTYIYVADWLGGIDAYTFNGTSLTYKATNTTNSDRAQKIWGDGTYIYVANYTRVGVFSFNGMAFTYITTDATHSTGANGVWGDGTYIYVADGAGGLDVYSFNGTSLTYITSDTTYTNVESVWGDGTYIYAVDYTGVTIAYTFNGTSLNFKGKDTAHSTNGKGVWGDGAYIYVADGSGGIDVYNDTVATCTSPARTLGTILYNPDYRTMQYCDGSSWQNMINTQYTAWGVTFDGTNDYLSYGTSFGADSTQATGSFWFRRNGGNGTQQILYCVEGGTTDCRFEIDLSTGNQIHVRGSSSGGGGTGTTRVEATGSTVITDTNWHHVLYSFDLTNSSNRSIYLDGVAESPTWGTYSNAAIDFTRTSYSFGAFGGGTGKFNGDIADFWLDEATYMDLSAAANRALFRDGNGYPVDLGSTGNKPTGSVPDVFFSGASVSTFNTNKADSVSWTLNGALTRANTQPALSCSHESNVFNYKATNTTNSTNAFGVWADGNYVYVADYTGGIDVYSFDGTNLTYKTTDTTHSGQARRVWGYGNYIFVADGIGGIDLYNKYNGTSLTYKTTNTTNTTDAYGVWADGTYVYVADSGNGLDVYSYSAISLTHITTQSLANIEGVWSDGSYIYVPAGSSGLVVYSFNGTTLTFITQDSTHSTNALNVWGDGTYIYVADYSGGIDVYSFNGTTLTYITTDTTNAPNARSVWGDGNYIYVADGAGGIDAYTFNGTSLTYITTDTTNSTNALGVWGVGRYIYRADYTGGIDGYASGVDTCTCSSPTGPEGQMIYNSDYSRYQFCDGRAWRSIGK
jgi:hypothetical protein